MWDIDWRSRSPETPEWLEKSIRERVYASRHGGCYLEPDGNGGMRLRSWYGRKYPMKIPAEADGLPVTSVADGAFRWSRSIGEELVLPESITHIGAQAFENSCVVSVRMPGVRSIGSRAFAGCEKLKYVYLPPCAEDIAKDAFEECDDVTVVSEGCSADIRLRKKDRSFPILTDTDGYEEPCEDEPVRTPDPDDFIIFAGKYRSDDITRFSCYFGHSSYIIGCGDRKKAFRLLTKQGELLRKYLGIGLETGKEDARYTEYRLFRDKKRPQPPWLTIAPGDHGLTEFVVDDLPAAAGICNTMILEYLEWCEERGEDPYYALILPCGKAPYHGDVFCPCRSTELRHLLIPARLEREWAEITDRQIKTELNMYLERLIENDDLVIETMSASYNKETERYSCWFEIAGIAGGCVDMDKDGGLYPYLVHIVNSKYATIHRVMLGLADSMYPSSLNDLCDLPPRVIEQILSAVTRVFEKRSGIRRDSYRICGSCKADVRSLDRIGCRYRGASYMTRNTGDIRRDQISWLGILSDDSAEKEIVTYGRYPVAEIRRTENGFDVSEMVRYSERQRREHDLYCAERFGWNVD